MTNFWDIFILFPNLNIFHLEVYLDSVKIKKSLFWMCILLHVICAVQAECMDKNSKRRDLKFCCCVVKLQESYSSPYSLDANKRNDSDFIVGDSQLAIQFEKTKYCCWCRTDLFYRSREQIKSKGHYENLNPNVNAKINEANNHL